MTTQIQIQPFPLTAVPLRKGIFKHTMEQIRVVKRP